MSSFGRKADFRTIRQDCSSRRLGGTQRFIALLPFVRLTLKARKPSDYPKNFVTLGDHLKARRLDLGFYLKDVALLLGTNEGTIINWEKDRTVPAVRFWPRIIDFLGYDPHPPPTSPSARVAAIRRNLGLSRKRLGELLGVDESVVAKWENRQPTLIEPSHERLIAAVREPECLLVAANRSV